MKKTGIIASVAALVVAIGTVSTLCAVTCFSDKSDVSAAEVTTTQAVSTQATTQAYTKNQHIAETTQAYTRKQNIEETTQPFTKNNTSKRNEPKETQSQQETTIANTLNGTPYKYVVSANVKGNYNYWYVLNGANVKVSGTYNYQTKQYTFNIIGLGASTGKIELSYLTDGNKVTDSIPVAVDKNGNVTLTGNIQRVKEEQAPTAQTTPTQPTTQSVQPTQATTASVLNGTPFIFKATGKTSKGYDWNYSIDRKNVTVNCTYDFKTNEYTFTVKGISAGTVNAKLMYKVSDNDWVTVPMTLTVDAKGNVSRIA